MQTENMICARCKNKENKFTSTNHGNTRHNKALAPLSSALTKWTFPNKGKRSSLVETKNAGSWFPFCDIDLADQEPTLDLEAIPEDLRSQMSKLFSTNASTPIKSSPELSHKESQSKEDLQNKFDPEKCFDSSFILNSEVMPDFQEQITFSDEEKSGNQNGHNSLKPFSKYLNKIEDAEMTNYVWEDSKEESDAEKSERSSQKSSFSSSKLKVESDFKEDDPVLSSLTKSVDNSCSHEEGSNSLSGDNLLDATSTIEDDELDTNALAINLEETKDSSSIPNSKDSTHVEKDISRDSISREIVSERKEDEEIIKEIKKDIPNKKKDTLKTVKEKLRKKGVKRKIKKPKSKQKSSKTKQKLKKSKKCANLDIVKTSTSELKTDLSTVLDKLKFSVVLPLFRSYVLTHYKGEDPSFQLFPDLSDN